MWRKVARPLSVSFFPLLNATLVLLTAVVLILAAALPAVSIPEWPLYSGVFDCTGSFLHWDSTGSLQGARRLLVSDNPETIGTGLSGLSSTLW